MGDWGILIITMVFASALVFLAVVISESFGKIWAPVWIVCFLIGMSILFDYGGIKQTELLLIGPMLFAAGPTMWPVLALGQDYLNEFYGPKIAYNYTFGMFLAKIGVALGTLWIIFVLPSPSDPALRSTAETFNNLMMLSPRLNIASIIAVVAAFLANAWTYATIRRMTEGRLLWARQIVAAFLSLTIDAIVFFFGAFLGVLPLGVIVSITVSYLMVAYITVFIDTAFLYTMVEVKKRSLFGIKDRLGESLTIETLRAYAARSEGGVGTSGIEPAR